MLQRRFRAPERALSQQASGAEEKTKVMIFLPHNGRERNCSIQREHTCYSARAFAGVCLFVTLNLSYGSALLAAHEDYLPNTAVLKLEGDIASHLVAGVDKFLLREIDRSTERRARHWHRDLSSVEKYNESIEPNRRRLAHILGVRDARVPFEAPELVGTVAQPALVGRGQTYDVFAVRWPAFGDVHGEGLLLIPRGTKVADMVAIPDADVTPEQLVGLTAGVAAESQFARRL